MQPDLPLEFGVYAGYKQNIGDDRVAPVSEHLAGITNTILSFPTLIGGAWLNARKTGELVAERTDPSGSQSSVKQTGKSVRVGDVVENTDAFAWFPWEEFAKAHDMSTGMDFRS